MGVKISRSRRGLLRTHPFPRGLCKWQGRIIDVRALRTLFGTLHSKGGVAPRTTQAAKRHSSIDLTMNVYTDPKLLDVYGALGALPSLDWKSSPSTERAVMRAAGTDDRNTSADSRHAVNSVAPVVAPTVGQPGQTVSSAVISSAVDDERMTRRATHENRMQPSKKALPAVFADKALKVEDSGIEPLTSCMPCKRSPS